MAFTKTPSTSKHWLKSSSQSPSSSSSSQNLIITKQFTYNNNKFLHTNKRKSLILLFFFFIFFILLCLLFLSSNSDDPPTITAKPLQTAAVWPFNALDNEFRAQENIRIGLINITNEQIDYTLDLLGLSEDSKRKTETVPIHFDALEADLEWKSLFPEWIDEDEKFKSPKCPNIPMPKTELYSDLDVVVLRIPCRRGIRRDAYRLQANLAAARVAVASGWVEEDVHRTVYVAFVGACGPMREIFRCDDLVYAINDDDDDRTVEKVRVYKPEMKRLKQKVLMPFGSCQLAPVYARTGWFLLRSFLEIFFLNKINSILICLLL